MLRQLKYKVGSFEEELYGKMVALLQVEDQSAEDQSIVFPEKEKRACKRGHLFTIKNTRIRENKGNPVRICRTCGRLRQREKSLAGIKQYEWQIYYSKNREALLAKRKEKYRLNINGVRDKRKQRYAAPRIEVV